MPSHKLHKRSRRKSRRKGPQRADLVLNFALTAPTNYISIPMALSMINRKLFSSNYTYAVESVTLFTTTASNPDIRIQTIPDNWPSRNSLVKAYHLWKDMRGKVLDQNPSLAGTWSDFKPAFDKDHTIAWQAGTPGLRPIDGNYVLMAPAAEWEQAQIVMPQHDVDPATGTPDPAITHYLHVLGDDDAASASLGIIKGYASTRATVHLEDPDDSEFDASNWMITLFDEGSADPELAANVTESNDRPPYDQDDYPGTGTNMANGQFQGYLSCMYDVATGAAKSSDSIGGFLAPAGLIKTVSTSTAGTEFLQIRLVPGSYKGVAAERLA